MPDLQYVDPRLAALYDLLNPLGVSDSFYLSLAGPAPKRVLDLGCGTGSLACAFAARGHRVTGADPARAMLDVARKRPGGASPLWVEADARDMRLGETFDFIVMTGHAFQVLLEDADVAALLATMRAHLAPGGRVAFETRNPLAREWETWSLPNSSDLVPASLFGPVEVTYEVVSFQAERLTFKYHYRFVETGEIVSSTSILRFMDRDALATRLAETGLRPIAWQGEWDGSPYAPTSCEIIVTAMLA